MIIKQEIFVFLIYELKSYNIFYPAEQIYTNLTNVLF